MQENYLNRPISYNYPTSISAQASTINNSSSLPAIYQQNNRVNTVYPNLTSQQNSVFYTYAYPQIIQTQQTQPVTNIPWLKDPVIKEALNKLREVKYLPGDVEHMRSLGVNLIYKDGNEAIKTILDKGIRIEFAQVSNPKIHAQWVNNENLIIINENYKNTNDTAVILAIAEAMFHELGHAKDSDGMTSIQEELDCLALNTLANRYHQKHYAAAFNQSSNAAIINDGVSLYTSLFFDKDPKKQALVNRVIEKYGDLPLESPNHTAPISALIVKKITNVKQF